jgi:NADH pyrophosphatase NudC (nudix superfamily)
MPTCENCIHYKACKATYEELTGDSGTGGNAEYCKYFKDRSNFIELKLAQWVKHKPDIEKMQEFHRLGIGKAMGENSIFWTCSNCNGWVSLSYQYCPHCGAKMKEAEQGLKERES